jgi:hypothetical protein
MVLFPAIFLLGPVTVTIVAVFAWRAWRRRALRELLPAVAALFVQAGALWVGSVHAHNMAHYWDGWELNADAMPSDLVGTWRHEGNSVDLGADGTFVTGQGTRGTWSLERGGFLVVAGGDSWHPLRRGDELVLMPYRADRADPDEWDQTSIWVRHP